jgi:hypothetical protein
LGAGRERDGSGTGAGAGAVGTEVAPPIEQHLPRRNLLPGRRQQQQRRRRRQQQQQQHRLKEQLQVSLLQNLFSSSPMIWVKSFQRPYF